MNKQQKIRKSLLRQLEIRKRQRAIVSENIMQPINDNIIIIRDVLAKRENIQKYINHSKVLNKHIKGLFRV